MPGYACFLGDPSALLNPLLEPTVRSNSVRNQLSNLEATSPIEPHPRFMPAMGLLEEDAALEQDIDSAQSETDLRALKTTSG